MASDTRKKLQNIVDGLDGVKPGPWEVSYNTLGHGPESERLCAFLQRVEYEELTGVIDETPEGDDPPSPILEHISRCDPDTMREIADLVEELDERNEALHQQCDRLQNEARTIVRIANETREANASQLTEIARLREALEWYADEIMAYSITQQKEPRSAVHADGGRRARAALISSALKDEGE